MTHATSQYHSCNQFWNSTWKVITIKVKVIKNYEIMNSVATAGARADATTDATADATADATRGNRGQPRVLSSGDCSQVFQESYVQSVTLLLLF